MSLLSELGMTSDELQQCTPPLRDRILERLSRISGMELIRNRQILDRSSRRLDAQTRAVRRQQGLNMPDDPDDEIVLGDKTTNTIGLLPSLIAGGSVMALVTALVLLFGPWDRAATPSEPPPVSDVDTDTGVTGIGARPLEDGER